MKDTKLALNKAFIDTLINRIITGTPATLLGLPGSGKTFLTNTVIPRVDKQSNNEVVHIHIDLDELIEISETEFYRALYHALCKTIKKQLPDSLDDKFYPDLNVLKTTKEPFEIFSEIKLLLEKVFNESNCRICLYIEKLTKASDLPITFFNSLNSLRTIDQPRLSMIFIDTPLFLETFNHDNSGNLYETMMGSIIWMPLPTRAQFLQNIKIWEKHFDYKLDSQQKEFIWQQTHGHHGLSKYLTLYLKENSNEGERERPLVEFFAISLRLEKILNSIPRADYEAIKMMVNKQPLNTIEENIDNLIKYGLISEKNGHYKLTINLLNEYLEVRSESDKVKGYVGGEIEPDQPVEIQIENSKLIINGNIVAEELSSNEIRLLEVLVEKKGQVVTREEIANCIWGDDYMERYSDWGIDQAMSRLRRKLFELTGSRKVVQTLKGRGFRLS